MLSVQRQEAASSSGALLLEPGANRLAFKGRAGREGPVASTSCWAAWAARATWVTWATWAARAALRAALLAGSACSLVELLPCP